LHIVKLKKCIKINTCHSRQIFGGGIWLGSCHEICWVANVVEVVRFSSRQRCLD